ncbi:MAG: phage holin family protein [Candidatus Eremiobacteraeota bacterium]|nr:phage holin family protein [Candidatus Eremiobacteraeota bacterium]
MMRLLIRFAVNAIALYCIGKYVPGFNHDVTVWTAVVAAIVFGLVNALLGPILRFFTFPLTILTLGLFSIVVNYALFAIVVWLAPHFHNTGEISPWLANLYGALIMMLAGGLAAALTKPDSQQQPQRR